MDPGSVPNPDSSESGSGSSTLGWMPIRIRIQCFDDKKLEKLKENEILYLYDKKLQFTYYP